MQLMTLKMLGIAPLQGQCWMSTMLGRLMTQQFLRMSNTLLPSNLTTTRTRHLSSSSGFSSFWFPWQSWGWLLPSKSTQNQLKIFVTITFIINQSERRLLCHDTVVWLWLTVCLRLIQEVVYFGVISKYLLQWNAWETFSCTFLVDTFASIYFLLFQFSEIVHQSAYSLIMLTDI